MENQNNANLELEQNAEGTRRQQAFDFLSDMIDKINRQDNRGTAFPYFYIVRTEKWRVANDEYYSGETKNVWVDVGGGEGSEWESQKEFAIDCIRHQGMTAKEARAYTEENLKEFVMEKYYDEDNIFFTEEGYKEHERMNSHNMGRRGEYYSYVKHAFRNPEISQMWKSIAVLCGKELKMP